MVLFVPVRESSIGGRHGEEAMTMRLSYDPDSDALRLTLDDSGAGPVRCVTLPGYIDMGESGRLIGIEVSAAGSLDLAHALSLWTHDADAAPYVDVSAASAYIQLSVSADTDVANTREAPATLAAEIDASGNLIAIGIPRRGAGYEITYPSGNR